MALAQATRTTPAAAATPPAAAAPTPDSEAFCTSIRDPAAEARFAWQAKTLKSLEGKLSDTLAKLEEKKAELKRLMDQRDAETQQAETRMVEIFSRMRPEAAALQLAAMDQGIAASLLGKLAPRNASAVLNEMEAARAAQLAEAMNGNRLRPANATAPTGARTR
ncbi:hypothetical protein DWF00_10830 [Bosea caraganae]|nr:hypothetical protein [Bosea caraganae]RDJ27443.1 hypothetical protein DWF00_10830 [Bosea caraganae]